MARSWADVVLIGGTTARDEEYGDIRLRPALARARAGTFRLSAPDLAVEILSESNTPAEMERKLREYFAAGTRLVWYADPVARSVTVYTSPEGSTVLREDDTLHGNDVLPGFRLPIREWFERAGELADP